tara:strand:+ start:1234 stop:1947 length:714 start_codon:yes stop_codon:yes gene_type:complete
VIQKNVFQTWKTLDFPYKIEKILNKNKKLNPDFKFHIYTDDQLFDFIKSNYDSEIFNAFEKLKHPVAKADMWRYLVLFKYGGVYLDIDSKFNNAIKTFINDDDEGVISAEKNEGNYVQWALFYKKGHPILSKTVEYIIANMDSELYKNDIENLTGPKVYARSVKEFYKLSEDKELEWSKINKNSNVEFEFTIDNHKHRARIFGIDYSNNVQFKHKYSDLLYQESDHWLKSQNEDSVY